MRETRVPVLRVQGPARQALTVTALRSIPPADLRNWLDARRWFGEKGRADASAGIDDVIPIPAQGAQPSFAVALVNLVPLSGESILYQVPLAVTVADAAGDALALVEHDSGSAAIVDAVTLPEFRVALGSAFREGSRFFSSAGDASWQVTHTGSSGVELPDETRVSSAEQSNSSIVFGDRAICKLFRRLDPGENPDVEISRFLTTRTSFRQCPAWLGSARLRRNGIEYTAAALSRFVAGASDAWSVALQSLKEFLSSERDKSNFSGAARELGMVTRRLHEALSSDEDDPAFAPAFATAADVSRWTAATIQMLQASFQLLEARTASLEGPIRDHARALLERREALALRIDTLGSSVDARGDPGMRIRQHGDYHLGQVLRSPEGEWLIIDFEGEPARPISERRSLHSPLRDVAGMIRSFAYAAATGSMAAGGVGRDPRLESRAARWERNAREMFLDGYLHPGETVLDAILPASTQGVNSLLALFEAEKTLYELAYELNNRPAWVWIPLRGIARMF